ncbi:MAG: type II CAAX endopeptidase family protein [Pseudoclavibacter sp.]|nr:type II CAAX endopeptidase family protein [Pseudoclavibacter sp.]
MTTTPTSPERLPDRSRPLAPVPATPATILFAILYAGCFLVLPVVQRLAGPLPAPETAGRIWATAVAYTVLGGLAAFAFRGALTEGTRRLAARGRSLLWRLPAAALLVIAVVTAGALLAEALSAALGIGAEELGNDERLGLAFAVLPPAVSIAVAGLLGPFVEETFFRLLLLGGLSRVLPFWTALTLSGALFGFMHAGSFAPAELVGVLPHVSVGIGLGIVSRWTGSIVVPIGLHALINLGAVLPAVL